MGRRQVAAGGRQLIETRWTVGRHPGIRVWFPGRSYRAAVAVWLTPGEAEALARNLRKRLAEGSPPLRAEADQVSGAEGTGGRA
jgi:hypothetical protein